MQQRDGMPFWVSLGLWGIGSRKVAMGFTLTCLLAAILALLGYGLGYLSSTKDMLIILAIALFCALWYWSSMRWVDNNGGWE